MTKSCIFCKIIAGEISAYTVYEDVHTLAFLDIAPFEKGHILVIPKDHVAYITDLSQKNLVPFMIAVQRVADLLLKKLLCDGFNLLQNNGTCATQTVPHVHFHVIPRWNNRPLTWVPRTYDDPAELTALHRCLTS